MKRIEAIHILRGIACGLVVFDHFFYAPPLINLGALGVGVFFLVSGFVIPISIEKITPSRFLVRRCFRLYPIAIVSTLSVYMFSEFVFPVYIKKDLPEMEPGHFLFTVLQVWDLVDSPLFRPIFWTLVIEEKFYWIMALIKTIDKDLRFEKVMSLSLAILVLGCMGSFYAGPYYGSLLFRNVMFISFMNLGVIYHYVYFRKIRSLKTVYFYTLLFVALSLFCLIFAPNGVAGESDICMIERFFCFSKKRVLVAYATASVVFFGFMVANRNAEHNAIYRFLGFLGTISYPLYVIHPEIWNRIGKVHKISSVFMVNQFFWFAVCIFLSYALHLGIEKPFIRAGKGLTS